MDRFEQTKKAGLLGILGNLFFANYKGCCTAFSLKVRL